MPTKKQSADDTKAESTTTSETDTDDQSEESGKTSKKSTKESSKTTGSDSTESRGRETPAGTTTEGEPSWLGQLTSAISRLTETQGQILEMVKPQETPDGAGTKIKKESKTETTDEIVTKETKTTQRPAKPGTRRLSLFKFRK